MVRRSGWQWVSFVPRSTAANSGWMDESHGFVGSERSSDSLMMGLEMEADDLSWYVEFDAWFSSKGILE